MSYDLYFRPAAEAPATDAVRAWFASRAHYEVGATQAFFRDPASGVYWSFDFADDGGRAANLSFNLNYYRPSFFGLQAAPEVAAFVETFGFAIEDPQSDGMGEGPFSQEGFLRGWNHGNRFGHRAIGMRQDPTQPVLTLPQATNTGIWAWNRSREAYMDLLGSIEMIAGFAPTIFLLVEPSTPDRIVTAVIWAEAMPCALPEVDVVLAMSGPQQPPHVIELDQLRPLLAGYDQRPGDHRFRLDGVEHTCGLRHWLADFEHAPAELAEALGTWGERREFQRVAPDSVLDRELVEAAKG